MIMELTFFVEALNCLEAELWAPGGEDHHVLLFFQNVAQLSYSLQAQSYITFAVVL
jgi:hypothetical protein